MFRRQFLCSSLNLKISYRLFLINMILFRLFKIKSKSKDFLRSPPIPVYIASFVSSPLSLFCLLKNLWRPFDDLIIGSISGIFLLIFYPSFSFDNSHIDDDMILLCGTNVLPSLTKTATSVFPDGFVKLNNSVCWHF